MTSRSRRFPGLGSSPRFSFENACAAINAAARKYSLNCLKDNFRLILKDHKMNELEFRAAVDVLRNKFAQHCQLQSPALVIPAAMEIVLNAAMVVEDKELALKLVESLRPMIDHIESQVRGTH